MKRQLVELILTSRSLMHKIRTNCCYESVELCLRYTAKDPRLRFNEWTVNSCGELTGGEFIYNLNRTLLAVEQKFIHKISKLIQVRQLFNNNAKELSYY